jgi:plastocyanin
MIGGQRIQVGLPHAGKTAEITIEPDTYQIAVGDAVTFTARRSGNGDIRRHKASHYPAAQRGGRAA